MWVIFILSAFCFGILALFTIYIGNKIILKMKKDELEFEKEKEKENK